ncbi:hypothetical protein SCLCIDRAFT_912632 [Scleroderma citrinum Foug A]|uniref:Protein kinase domain-containing protein n=1 Tax=Scleroderma citrinum Foug A TaxID=1036808 RepID=A0A0C2ZI08_9AGAM|nr:hypothetical protein SCLCIDRAFT_912632 [Scleroderma citrinum Foug A]
MWKDSRKYPVRIEVIPHPGSCPCSERKVYDRIASIDLGHRVSRDASKRIGSSTYGDVFEGTLSPEQTKASGNGTDSETLVPQAKQKVAIKVVRYVDKDALTVLMRILSGIYAWWNLAHENVAELLGITANFDHTISIVSPLIPRGDAFRYVQDPNVDPRPLILGISNGLDYLHTRKIIHGGIKGTNVLVSNDGHALLTDLGSSCLAEASFSLVVKGDLEGTLDWMAPEHLKADKFTMSAEADVWAFGMTTLELLTRKRPFDHFQNIGAIINHIVYKELTRPRLDASFFRLTDEWWSICLSCWNHDPVHRAPMSNIVENIRTLQTESKIIVGELLQSAVDQRFPSLDLGDRVSRDESRLVGFGTYGIVYEGTLDPGQTKVAVKVVRYGDKSALPVLEVNSLNALSSAMSHNMYQKLLKEVHVWSKLDHENVIKLLGLTAAFNHTLSIVSPLMSRGNAFDYVQDPDVDPRPLIYGIANGLHYLHTYIEGPIIHGDIKGRNVLVSNEGHALLSDFGSSHFAAASFNLAVEGLPGGTLNWMAPEYLEMKEFKTTTAGDVWAFGMTVLELFTRKRPFDHLKSDGAIIRHILLEERGRPNSDASCSRLTDEWWNMCLLCWNRDPSQRAQTSRIVSDIGTLQHQTKSEVDARSLPREVLTDDNNSFDPRMILKELAKRALRYSINLDGLVSKDNVYCLRGGHVTVTSGILQPRREELIGGAGPIKVAIKTPRGGFTGDAEAIKVRTISVLQPALILE